MSPEDGGHLSATDTTQHIVELWQGGDMRVRGARGDLEEAKPTQVALMVAYDRPPSPKYDTKRMSVSCCSGNGNTPTK